MIREIGEYELNLAEESDKTKRAREKLQKKYKAFENRINKKELEKKLSEIHRWIARHAPSRVVLKAKNISLFDGNQNSAKLSQKVAILAETLKN